MKRIPIRAAKSIAKEFNQRQVILLTWDGERSHLVSYGATVEDCDQAAMGAKKVMDALGWEGKAPEPSRVRKLQKEIEKLKDEIQELKNWGRALNDDNWVDRMIDSRSDS
jgi:hypothetical protein